MGSASAQGAEYFHEMHHKGLRQQITSTPATVSKSFLATAPAATRPIVSLADDLPPPATCARKGIILPAPQLSPAQIFSGPWRCAEGLTALMPYFMS